MNAAPYPPAITALPPSSPGMRIGLFGGSFNPPHEGHRLVSRECLRRLALDAVWWLVTPGNPLKDHAGLAPLEERVTAARALIDSPREHATGFEAAHGLTYTWQTLSHLQRTLPGRNFVWIMGADSLANFHRWKRWEDIFALMPMAIYVRPGATRKAIASRAATRFGYGRIAESDAPLLAGLAPPAWVLLHGRTSSLSSTQLREERDRRA